MTRAIRQQFTAPRENMESRRAESESSVAATALALSAVLRNRRNRATSVSIMCTQLFLVP